MTDELVQRHVEQLRLTGGDLADLCQPLADAIEYLIAERDRLREVLTALHKQALMLRGEQSYREFARAVEKQARAALKGETP